MIRIPASDRYDSLFVYYGGEADVDWKLLKAMVRQESAFQPDAISRAGAAGLAQFMARTWQEWRDGTPGIQPPPPEHMLVDPRDPEDAIRAQAYFVGWLLSTSLVRRELGRCLAAYNWGYGNLSRALDRHGAAWLEHAPRETRDYVDRIRRIYDEYLGTEYGIVEPA